MNAENIEKLIIRILSGKQVFRMDEIPYELKPYSTDLKIEACLLYDKIYQDHVFDSSFMSSEDIESLLYEMGILYPKFDNDLTSIQKNIENLKVELYQNFFDRTKNKQIKQKIGFANKRYSQMISYKHMLDFLTLEHYCSHIKNAFLICNSLYYYKTNNLVFDFQDTETTLFDKIANEISTNIVDIPTLKLLARSDYWRNYYTINKNHLFPYSASELTDEQKGIMSISLMYERVYEHPDCPDKDVIDDDDALDGWMIHQQRENKRQKKEKGVNSLLGKNKGAQEVFLVAGNDAQKDDILGLNTDASNFKRQSRINEVLSAKAPIKEFELSDVQNDLRQQLNKLSVKR